MLRGEKEERKEIWQRQCISKHSHPDLHANKELTKRRAPCCVLGKPILAQAEHTFRDNEQFCPPMKRISCQAVSVFLAPSVQSSSFTQLQLLCVYCLDGSLEITLKQRLCCHEGRVYQAAADVWQ